MLCFQTDTLSSLEAVISQSNGAMEEVRAKLQGKETLITELETQLRNQSVSGTLRLSPHHSLLLRSKASPLRDILLTGPSSRAHLTPAAMQNHKPKAHVVETFDKTVALHAFYGAVGPTVCSKSELPTSPPVEPKRHVDVHAERNHNAHIVTRRKGCPETDISYIEPIATSTMLGQSMFEMSPPKQKFSPKKALPEVRGYQASKKLPFSSYVSPLRHQLRQPRAVSVISECTEESDCSFVSIPLSAYKSDAKSSGNETALAHNNCEGAKETKSSVDIVSPSKVNTKKAKELPFEHPLTAKVNPKYLNVFKEQMVERKLNKTFQKSGAVSTNVMSESTSNLSKVAALVDMFEFAKAKESKNVTSKMSIRRKSKSHTKLSPGKKRSLLARGNKASELRMKAKCSVANKTCTYLTESKEILFTHGKS